jgi:hypothetical protein
MSIRSLLKIGPAWKLCNKKYEYKHGALQQEICLHLKNIFYSLLCKGQEFFPLPTPSRNRTSLGAIYPSSYKVVSLKKPIVPSQMIYWPYLSLL